MAWSSILRTGLKDCSRRFQCLQLSLRSSASCLSPVPLPVAHSYSPSELRVAYDLIGEEMMSHLFVRIPKAFRWQTVVSPIVEAHTPYEMVQHPSFGRAVISTSLYFFSVARFFRERSFRSRAMIPWLASPTFQSISTTLPNSQDVFTFHDLILTFGKLAVNFGSGTPSSA